MENAISHLLFLNKKGMLYLITFAVWMSRTGKTKVWDSESVALYLIEKPDLIRKHVFLAVFNNFTAFKKALEIKDEATLLQR